MSLGSPAPAGAGELAAWRIFAAGFEAQPSAAEAAKRATDFILEVYRIEPAALDADHL